MPPYGESHYKYYKSSKSPLFNTLARLMEVGPNVLVGLRGALQHKWGKEDLIITSSVPSIMKRLNSTPRSAGLRGRGPVARRAITTLNSNLIYFISSCLNDCDYRIDVFNISEIRIRHLSVKNTQPTIKKKTKLIVANWWKSDISWSMQCSWWPSVVTESGVT